jgi:predicted PurR-regulated permease PerM
MSNKILCVLILSLLVVVPVQASPLSQLIADAEQTRLKAAKAGFEWSTTAKLIKQAKAAQSKGDKKQASVLANKALKQAQNSLKQAKHAEQHWQKSQP